MLHHLPRPICSQLRIEIHIHEPLTRYIELQVEPAPGTVYPRQLQRKPLASEPGMHHGTCVTHLPWCLSGSLTCGGGENVPGIPGPYATRNFTYLARAPCWFERYWSSLCGCGCGCCLPSTEGRRANEVSTRVKWGPCYSWNHSRISMVHGDHYIMLTKNN